VRVDQLDDLLVHERFDEVERIDRVRGESPSAVITLTSYFSELSLEQKSEERETAPW
jgi:hypothetical protein